MPYPRTIGPEIEAEISSYTEKLIELKGGESFIITSPSSSMKQIEYWLRCWLSVKGYPKGTYRISKESPTSLRILKRFGTEGRITADTTDDGVRFTLDHLLSIETEEEVIEILQKAREEEKLGPEQFLRALEEWKKVIGRKEE